MANNGSIMKGIVNSWSLLDFAKSHGAMKIAPCTNKETGESFKACAFVNPKSKTLTFVSFSSKLGELTPQQIAAQKNELQVVQLESGNFSLCKQGKDTWESVNLF